MDPLMLARLQFGITTVYHFFFVPLTIGLSVTVALMETLYVTSGNEVYKRMTKFWGKLFLINFAMGVVTGIVQEFQFGMNWSEYSRFVGDIFGVPLAIEALMAFFLESTFIGIWIFGWDKLSKGLHAAVIWLVAIGVNVSALWILVANSFMQEPMGYVINNGRAEMVNFLDLLLNPNLWVQLPHTISAGFVTSSFFILGISTYHLYKRQHISFFKRSFQIAAIIGTIAAVMVILNGHSQGQHMVESQPMKMAAAEALFETESPASFSILTIGDLAQRNDVFSIRIPRLLCLISFNTLDCEVQGINELQESYRAEFGPGDYIPPVAWVYWSFRAMVGAGVALLGLALYALFLVMGDMIETRKGSLRLFTWAIALPYIANSAGWIMTEVGRIPWTVYGVLLLDQSVSNTVPGAQVLISLIGYTLIYAALIVATIYLMHKYATAGPSEPADSEPEQQEPEPSMVPAQD
jgi:cytochrome d ubiquinol oxidase subunit I